MNVFAIVGAGNGGQASAVDLTLQGRRVRLFEFSEFAGTLDDLRASRRLRIHGAVSGEAVLEMVTTDLREAVQGADAVMVCTQALAHERAARELAAVVTPEQTIILNPGSTGGALKFARVFREAGHERLPVLAELSTLTYGCRANDGVVDCPVKPGRVLCGTLPAAAIDDVAPELQALFPGVVRAATVLEAGLNNANPIIHPPLSLLNGARFENEGAAMFLYQDGVSPTVARLIEKLDRERMALLQALGYPAQPDPVTCVEQGYAADSDYFECYARGPGFAPFRSPDTLDNRYFHEDMGIGLVLYNKLGQVLGVPTPVAEAFVRIGSVISDIDYFEQNGDILTTLGIDGLSAAQLRSYLESGALPA
jgi:opine dehydrogenase